jgi:hypothetical protein
MTGNNMNFFGFTKHAFAAVILFLSVAQVAAGPLDDAVAAHKSGDYATALRLLRPLADQGDAPGFQAGALYQGTRQAHRPI